MEDQSQYQCYPVDTQSPPRSFLVLLQTNASGYALKGMCQVKVLGPSGSSVSVTGHKITADDEDDVELFAARGYSLLKLVALRDDVQDDGKLRQRLRHLDLAQELIDTVVSQCTTESLVCVLMSRSDQAWIQRLEKRIKGVREAQLFGRTTSLELSPMPSSWKNMQSLLDMNLLPMTSSFKARVFQEGQEWKNVIETEMQRESSPRILFMGGKGVGKSTFTRFCLNRILRMSSSGMVYYIDLDPGQPEFTPPGFVSVMAIDKPSLGPNLCLLDRKKLCSLFVGDINVSNVKDRYLRCLQSIATFCSGLVNTTNTPILINTMGFNVNLGETLLIESVRTLEPTLIVNIRSTNPRKNYSNHVMHRLNAMEMAEVINVSAVPETTESGSTSANSSQWGHPEPRKLRNFVLLSHLSQMPPESSPKRVPWSQINIQFLLDLPKECFFSVIVGCFVSLEVMSKEVIDGDSSTQFGLRFVNKSALGQSKGLGLVVSLDRSSSSIFILTSLTLSELAEVNCLTFGAIRAPDWYFLEPGCHQRPYTSSTAISNPLHQPWVSSGRPKHTQASN